MRRVHPKRAPVSRLPPVEGPAVRLPPIESPAPARLPPIESPPAPSVSQSQGADGTRQGCCHALSSRLLPFWKTRARSRSGVIQRPAAPTAGGRSTTAAATTAAAAAAARGGGEADASDGLGRWISSGTTGGGAVMTAQRTPATEYHPPMENMCYRALYAMGIDVDEYVSMG